jgi:hypothetical protein
VILLVGAFYNFRDGALRDTARRLDTCATSAASLNPLRGKPVTTPRDDESPVAENVHDLVRRRPLKRPNVFALIARGDDGGVCLTHEKIGVASHEVVRLVRRVLQRSGHVFTVVLPSLSELMGSAQTGEACEGSRMFDVDRATFPQPTANMSGRSRNEVLDGDHW